MMYGFGDDPNPLPESVALLEDIVVEYVTDLTHKALDVGSKRAKISVEDFLYLIRKVPVLQSFHLSYIGILGLIAATRDATGPAKAQPMYRAAVHARGAETC
ncbi:Transcription initiation factor TFIID subunit 13 [Linum perenne]